MFMSTIMNLSATTCPGATVINPATLPIVNQSLVCGGANDLNSTNVPGTLCGTGDLAVYKNGIEALYTFTPTTSGTYNAWVNGQAYSSIQIWAGCPTAGGTCVYGDGNTGTYTSINVPLVAGTNYFIWFDTWPSPNSPCPGLFGLSLPPPPPPACGTTFSDPAGPGANYANNTNFTRTYCPSVAGDMVTLTFTQFATEANWDFVTIYNGPSTASPVLGTFSGASIPGPFTSSAVGGCLTLNFTSDGSGVAAGWYGNVTCGPPVPPPPACGTTVYDPGGTGDYANNANFTATYCPTVAGQVVTMNFTAFNTESGLDVITIYNGPTTASPVLGSYSGTANPGAITSTDASGCLTVRFTSDGSVVRAGWTANIICGPPPPPLGNDNPCGATNLPVNTSCINTAGTTSSSTGTTGPPPPTCSNYVTSDVWFKAVVPANGSLIIETSPGVITDGGMAVYTAASCAGPFTQIACDDDGGVGLMPALNLTGLAPGTTVYIRFWEYGGDNNGSFSICVSTPPPPPTGDCVYVLNLYDSFGDGWGSSQVGVSINGGPNTWYTVTGAYQQVLFGVNIGNTVVLTYDASGPWQGEVSFSLGMLNGGVFYNSGSAPPGGVVFAQSVDCLAPAAAPQDCAGGVTICSGQAFNNNSSNTGNVVDLNTANQGCLSGGEQQGTWYYFSPSASGNIGFTINPSAPTDYDFALWGPMSTISCPPTGAPLRCSWAAPNGPTGLGNGAVDPSEGAGGDRWVSTINVLAGQIYVLYVDNFSSNGQSFSLSWNLADGASLDCTVLPVEFIEFKAIPDENSVDLSWTTGSESNTSHFIIERSKDGIDFSPIGSLNAAGNSYSQIKYSYPDDNPIIGMNYYRLTQVDIDGSEVKTKILDVLFTKENGITIFPNPVDDEVTVYLNDIHGEQIHIIDVNGKIVKNININELNNIKFSMNGLDSGSYILVITNGGSSIEHTRFIKK